MTIRSLRKKSVNSPTRQFLPDVGFAIFANHAGHHHVPLRIEAAHFLLRSRSLEPLFECALRQQPSLHITRHRLAFTREANGQPLGQPTWRAILADRIDDNMREFML